MKVLSETAFRCCLLAGLTNALTIPGSGEVVKRNTSCENTATSRSCWGEYGIDTDYYNVIPDTGVTREYWLVAQNITAAPDGYERQILAFTGTVPGATIMADWGDYVVVYVTNEIPDNGTSVHWHGIRQLNGNECDGVPGVTQCPIVPGATMTYKFRAEQYGTTWYHSHFSVQTIDGLAGPLIINGPATADYDIHLGAFFLTDWDHETAFKRWEDTEIYGGFPIIPSGLINGTNTFDCTSSTDTACLGTGKRFEITFEQGKKYRIGVVGTQADGYLSFAIDGHSLTVIANDLVPVEPYVTNQLVVGGGQRFDIIVEADQPIDNYWMRTIIGDCNVIFNSNWNNIRGIVQYEGSDTMTDPVSTTTLSNYYNCWDEGLAGLTPWLSKTVGEATSESELVVGWYYDLPVGLIYHWSINTQALEIDWAEPTLKMIADEDYSFPTDYSVKQITAVNQWVYFIIQDLSLLNANHPIHLHGHDYYVIAQGKGVFVEGLTPLTLVNPPRRDTAILPGNGYLVMAFYADNPGTWLMHCHIIWHASQGFALQFVERDGEIAATIQDPPGLNDTCTAWEAYTATERYVQDDSEI